MTSAGFALAGSSLAGVSVIVPGVVANPATLPDQVTSLPQTCRLLVPGPNGQGGSWAFTSDGRVVGCGTVRQLVQLAVTTRLGTSCALTLGTAYGSLQEKGPRFQRQVATVVANAFAPIAQYAQLISVDVQESASNQDSGIATVKWRDLTTGQEATTPIGP